MRAEKPLQLAEGGLRTQGACEDCLRRCWLLAELSAQLDHCSRDRSRLIALLALDDRELVQAIGGRRKMELGARYAQFDRSELRWAKGVEAVCRHDRRYPRTLRYERAPRLLNVAGGVERLGELTTAPVVAIVGSRRASDYGMEVAKSFARGLAASGVTVTSGLTDGIAVAAHSGALEVEGRTVAVMTGGLDVACPASRRSLYERLRRGGCAVAELPCGAPARRWGQIVGDWSLAGLAELTVVVEAQETLAELAGARMARDLRRTVAAVPGRVTSPLSRGTNALLMGEASLVREPEDVLELLFPMGPPPPRSAKDVHAALEPRLQATLARVATGLDTPDKLTGKGEDAGAVLLALSELELMGLLARGDGGRYVLRGAPPAS